VKANRVTLSVASVVVAAGLTAACGGGSQPPAQAPAEKIVPQQVGEMSPEEAGGMSPEASSLKEGATAPHGGSVVTLGTAGHLEFVHDPSSGLLTAYVLDKAGHAVMRIPAKAIAVEVTPPGGKPVTVSLVSTANGLTGDTVGNSSQFGGTSAALKGVTAFEGVVKDATIGGESFKDVKFTYPPAK
jgi:hypothetical protein